MYCGSLTSILVSEVKKKKNNTKKFIKLLTLNIFSLQTVFTKYLVHYFCPRKKTSSIYFNYIQKELFSNPSFLGCLHCTLEFA